MNNAHVYVTGNTKVTAKEIMEHVKIQYTVFNSVAPEELSKTVGALNGVDMQTYNQGYTDALLQILNFYESRV